MEEIKLLRKNMKPLILVRQSHRVCASLHCDMNVSRGCDQYCYKCARKGSEEYMYHKHRLPRFILKEHYPNLYDYYFN